MKKTLSIDPDVAELLKRAAKQRGMTFSQTVNEALRLGLGAISARRTNLEGGRTRSVDCGRCELPNVDNIAEVVAWAEGESYK